MENCPVFTDASTTSVRSGLFVIAYDNVTVTGCDALEMLDIGMLNDGARVYVSNMKSLWNIGVGCESTADIQLSDMPALYSASLGGDYIGGVLPQAIQEARRRNPESRTFYYEHKYQYDYDYVEREWVWRSTTTNDYGFYFPGEPGQHYHFDPAHPNN